MMPLESTVTSRAAYRIQQRRAEQTAGPRALVYALFSKLTSSPFERPQMLEDLFAAGEVSGMLAELEEALPYRVDLQTLRDRLAGMTRQDVPALAQVYSSFFEVGNDGPPVPLRAELVRTGAGKPKEELIRFYNFFSYTLEDRVAWAPDHLSILLEFMQVLCLRESEQSDLHDESFQRAQRDFLKRHIMCWLPVSLGRLVERDPKGFYTLVMTTLWEFLEQELQWNAQTVPTIQEED